jgi:hypothetical protein
MCGCCETIHSTAHQHEGHICDKAAQRISNYSFDHTLNHC